MWHRNLKDLQLKFEDPLCQCQIIKKDCSTKNSQPQSINEARRGVVFCSSVKFLPASVAKAQEVENCPLENLKQSKVISENLKRGSQSFLNNSCCCQLEIWEVSEVKTATMRWKQCLWHRFSNMLRMLTTAVSALFWNLSKISCTLNIIGQRRAYSHISDVTLRLGDLFILLWVKAATMTAMISHTQPSSLHSSRNVVKTSGFASSR